ncbi:MAG: hypothetical protein R2701_08115 [Acidimicrobiales bacterium]
MSQPWSRISRRESAGCAPDTPGARRPRRGDAGDADLASGIDVGAHLIGERVAGEHRLDLVGVEATSSAARRRVSVSPIGSPSVK